MLSKNPNLTADKVKEIFRDSCDQIDASGGSYNQKGHSRKYGYGRVNAEQAVALA